MKQQKQVGMLSKDDANKYYSQLKSGEVKVSFIKYTGNKETDKILTRIIQEARGY